MATSRSASTRPVAKVADDRGGAPAGVQVAVVVGGGNIIRGPPPAIGASTG